MFSPGSLDKNSLNTSENCSPGRSKFGVGINPLGDESQQNIRIQLAVRRYNNSAGSSFYRPFNERNFSGSGYKNAFLKNSQKYENIENDKDESLSHVKKSFNQYQGVGNFPVVHLKKNALISKPVKRSSGNAFKIQLPELPFNRYLNSAPDVSLDTKTSTRSVLDVLQDLSRKRIHTKDDNVMSKRKCKGLGGDAPLDIEAPYKPLFVSKNKSNTVVTRDSTTQTQETSTLDMSKLKKVETVLSTEPEDPRAELRRKLARQNNEIFASLSSSTLTYPCKKNSEKLTKILESVQQNSRLAKAAKLNAESNDKNSDIGSFKSSDSMNGGSVNHEFSKIEKKHKKAETNKISPNKDRLTTIYLEMKNPSPKIQGRSSSGESSEKEEIGLSPRSSLSLAVEESSKSRATVGKDSESGTLQKSEKGLGGSGDNSKSILFAQAGTESGNKISISEKMAPTALSFNLSEGSGKMNAKEAISCQGIAASSSENASPIFVTSAGSNVSSSSPVPAFKMPLVSTVSSSLLQTPIFSIGIPSKDNNTFNANVDRNSKVGLNSLADGSSSERKSFGSASSLGTKENALQTTSASSDFFKFGAGDTNFLRSHSSLSEPKITTPVSSSEGNSAAESPAKQPSLLGATTPNVSNSANVENNGAQSNGANAEKGVAAVTETPSLFTLNAAPNPVTSSTPVQNQQTASPFSFSEKTLTTGGEKPATLPFTFGNASFGADNKFPQFGKTEEKNKNEEASKNEESVNQEKSANAHPAVSIGVATTAAATVTAAATTTATANATTAAVAPTFAVTTSSTNNNVTLTGSIQNDFPSSSFPLSTTAPSFGQNVTGSFQANNTQTVTPFKFGEKNENEKSLNGNSTATNSGNLFGFQKSKSNVFTFGQKPQEGTPSSTSDGQSAMPQPNLFQQNNVFSFGQKSTTPVSSASLPPQGAATPFGQSPPAQSNLFQQGAGSQPASVVASSASFGSASQTSGATSQSMASVPSFAPASTTGNTLSPMNNTFTGQNKLNVSTFGQSTNTFGQTSSTNFSNQGNIFGTSSSQNTPGFGVSTGSSSSTPFAQPFGDNSAKPQSTFGQTSNFFMQSPAQTGQASAFSQGSSFGAGTFGQTQTPESNVFGQKPGGFEQSQNVQGTPFGQASTTPAFGSQTPFTFGAPAAATTSSGFPLNPATTVASVFTFGSTPKSTTSTTSTFSFSNTSQPNSNSQSVFTFSGQSDNNFKFGASNPNAGASGARPFGFDAGTGTPGTSDPTKPPSVFNFGSSQTTSSNTGFNFGATPSPSVFSFGGSGSSTNSNSKFTFGATPSPNMMFPQGATPSPSTSVPMQGIFNIGSGSTQPRSRISASRARRRT